MGNIKVGVQGNTMSPLQSAQYGGPHVGYNEQTCMHHTIGSKCTWLSSHYGHTTQWGALQTRTTMVELRSKTMPCVPKAYKLLWALRKRSTQEFVNNIIVSQTKVGELVNKSLHLSMLRKMNMKLA